ncbi:pseudouridine synthase [Firmicutes bacterium CAG:94]|nr:pseudouridine synthase [Firmicutes bacterium CAG:94]
MLKHWRNRAAALGLSLCLVGALCPVAQAAGPEVSAQSAVVLTADTGTVLFEKDGHTPRPVASTTKIMTALLALEAAQERGDPLVDITQEMVAVEGSSMGLQAGDSISLTETGRTHQIRVHMAYLGHPVAGDPVYGPKKSITSLEGQCLHAGKIGFVHPRTGEYLEFEAPLPAYFTGFLQKLKEV